MRRPILSPVLVVLPLSALLIAAPARTAQEGDTPQAQTVASTVSVEIPGSGMQVEVPAAWRPGIMRGAGTVLHYLGSGDGFPHFSVQTDPEARMSDESTTEMERQAVEGLFDAIVEATGAEVVSADWVDVNGVTVHSSLTRRDSVTGPLQMRRVLVVVDRTPFVLVWGDREASYPEVAALIEQCVGSLRPSD